MTYCIWLNLEEIMWGIKLLKKRAIVNQKIYEFYYFCKDWKCHREEITLTLYRKFQEG